MILDTYSFGDELFAKAQPKTFDELTLNWLISCVNEGHKKPLVFKYNGIKNLLKLAWINFFFHYILKALRAVPLIYITNPDDANLTINFSIIRMADGRLLGLWFFSSEKNAKVRS